MKKQYLIDRNTTHNMSKTRVYRLWAAMKTRCTNPNQKHYNRYGGRGITFDPSWEKFENFFEDMGIPKKTQSLDRIDPNGNYCKENCRWVSFKTQANNKTNNKTYLYKNKIFTISELSEIAVVSYDTLHQRLVDQGWDLDEAINTPANKHNNKNYKRIEINGVVKSLAEWCREYNQNYAKVHKRLNKYGYPLMEALTKP